uniref:transglutaminase-like domain-containing protein n=1 Tax=Sedimenticola hydrogenitrophicus TaxID=2967975 RepID=UPI0023AEB745
MSFRLPWSAVFTLLLFATVSAYWIWWKPVENQPNALPAYPIERNIRYSYLIKNVSGKYIKQTDFWSYAPVKQTSTQKILDIQSANDFRLEIDGQGNQRLLFTLSDIPPYGTKTITVNVSLGMSESPNRLPNIDTKRFLRADQYIELDLPKIKNLSKQLQGADPYETAEANFKWVTQNLTDAGFVQNDRGAAYAINSKSGDCTEYMYLLTALNRSSGIPTQGVSGFVVKEDSVLRSREYHNWTVTFIDGVWQIIDPHKESFMSNNATYIAMRL